MDPPPSKRACYGLASGADCSSELPIKIPSNCWIGLYLPDELLIAVLSKLGQELVFAASVRNDLLSASQVCKRTRSLIHQHVATSCVVRQPHLRPSQEPASLSQLSHLPFHTYSAVTHLDLSQCLDWIQHPSLRELADLSPLRSMHQLRSVNLRPHLDHIDASSSGRIKCKTNVLCWADGVMLRIWDRWMYGPSANVSGLINIKALSELPNLEKLVFPILERNGEDAQQRLLVSCSLKRLETLTLGRATVDLGSLALLQQATALRSLSIGKCAGFIDDEVQVLASLQQLESLYLFGCHGMELSASGWAPLTRLTCLKHLALYGRQEGENVHFWKTMEMNPHSLPINADAFRTLCALTSLQKLRLGGCRGLQGSALLHVTLLMKLTCLEVSGCPCVNASVLPCIMARLPGLQRLNLRSVRGPALESQLCMLSSLPEMQALSLDIADPRSNGAEATTAAASGLLTALLQLSKLEALQLWHNSALCMSLGDAARISRLQRLQRLSIKSCTVTKALLRGIAEIQGLRTLELADCSGIDDESVKQLAKLSHLQNLDLYHAPLIGDAGVAHLAGQMQLLSFRMVSSAVSDKSLGVITQWKSLRNLSLEGAENLSSTGLCQLTSLTLLKILDLAGCMKITDDGLLELSVMGELRQLNLERCTSITNNGVENFRAKILAAGPPGHGGSGSIIVFF